MSKRFLFAFCTALGAGCASHEKVGMTYEQLGNLPIAVEYYAKALEENPNNNKIRERILIAEQHLEWQLRHDIRRLTENSGHAIAIKKLLSLEAAARHMKSLDLKHEDPDSLYAERQEVTLKAINILSAELDQRLTRGQRLKSDLRACRQISALAVHDEALKRRCDMLQNNMKLTLKYNLSNGLFALNTRVAKQLNGDLKRLNLDLIDVEATLSNPPTGQLNLIIQPAQITSTEWVQTNRQQIRGHVERRDKNGQILKKKVVTNPTPTEIKQAKVNKKPKPKPTINYKTLYKEVSGEYIDFQKNKRVKIPYTAKLIDLRNGAEIAAVSGEVTSRSSAKCHQYKGHPEAKRLATGSGHADCNVAFLASDSSLIDQSIQQIVTAINKRLIRFNED